MTDEIDTEIDAETEALAAPGMSPGYRRCPTLGGAGPAGTITSERRPTP